MKENNDLENAMKMFLEEMEGIKEYTRLYENTTDPVLKKIYAETIPAEKQHAGNLFSYISREVAKTLK